jgi:hypothetical protein
MRDRCRMLATLPWCLGVMSMSSKVYDGIRAGDRCWSVESAYHIPDCAQFANNA